jgi:putative hemolysin
LFIFLEDTKEEIKAKVIDELHSVYPVCEDNLDECYWNSFA